MAFDVSWIYQIVDKYSAPLKKIKKVTDKAAESMNNASDKMTKMGSKMANLNSAIGAAAGIAAISFPIKKAVAFEDAMIDVQKVLEFKDNDQFEQFREGIFKTAISLGKLPKDIAAIAIQGGKLGIAPENLNQFIDLIARTSVAFDMLEGPAAEVIGSIKTKLDLTTKTTGKLMDAINFLADNTATSGARAIEVVSRTVGTMKTIEMPPELIAGWAAFADQIETSPELAASGLNMMMTRMMKMPGMMKKLLKNPTDAIRGLLGEYSKMNKVKRAGEIFKKFGLNAGKFVLKAVNSTKLLDKTLLLVGKNSKFSGSMLRELEKKLAGTKTALGKIGAVADFAMISIGDVLLPAIKQFTPAIVNMVSSLTKFLKKHPFIVKIGVAFIAILVTASAIGLVLGLIIGAIGTLISPVAAIILGVVAIAAAFAWVYYNIDLVISYLGSAITFLRKWIPPLDHAIMAVEAIIDGIKFLYSHIGLVKSGFYKFISFVKPAFIFLYNIIKKIATFGLNMLIDPIGTIIDSVKTLYEWWNKISNLITGVSTPNELKKLKISVEETPVSVENSTMKNEINGRIEVSASPGSEIRKTEMDHAFSGDLGLNMAS